MNDMDKLKNYSARLHTVINELETLEDSADADYSYCVVCLQQATMQLERRREQLQRRGRYL